MHKTFYDLTQRQRNKIIKEMKADGYKTEAELVANGHLWDEEGTQEYVDLLLEGEL